MRFNFDQKRRCSCCCSFLELFDCFPGKISASGAPTNVTFLPSPIHFFHKFQQRLVVAQIKNGFCHRGAA